MNISEAQKIIKRKLQGKNLKKVAKDFFSKQGKSVNFGDCGWVGKFVAEYCFGQKHDNLQSKDFSWGELKTMGIQKGVRRPFNLRNLDITACSRDSIVSQSFKNHPVYDKCTDILIVYHVDHVVVSVAIFDLNSDQDAFDRAERDYLAYQKVAKRRSEINFLTEGFEKIRETKNRFFTMGTKNAGKRCTWTGERRKLRTLDVMANNLYPSFEEGLS